MCKILQMQRARLSENPVHGAAPLLTFGARSLIDRNLNIYASVVATGFLIGREIFDSSVSLKKHPNSTSKFCGRVQLRFRCRRKVPHMPQWRRQFPCQPEQNISNLKLARTNVVGFLVRPLSVRMPDHWVWNHSFGWTIADLHARAPLESNDDED